MVWGVGRWGGTVVSAKRLVCRGCLWVTRRALRQTSQTERRRVSEFVEKELTFERFFAVCERQTRLPAGNSDPAESSQTDVIHRLERKIWGSGGPLDLSEVTQRDPGQRGPELGSGGLLWLQLAGSPGRSCPALPSPPDPHVPWPHSVPLVTS